MIRVDDLIDKLKNLPMNALAYAYEGEIVGIVVVDAENKKEIGYIPARETDIAIVNRDEQDVRLTQDSDIIAVRERIA